MPAYPNNPFTNLKLLTVDFPEYFIGSYNFDVPYGLFQITSNAISSDTATVTGYMSEGNIPAIGDIISVQGTQNQSGSYNVNDAAITLVSINSATGEGSISYALSHANETSAPDAGRAVIIPAEGSEAISANYTSIAIVTESNNPNANNARTYTVVVSTPTNSSFDATFTLEGAHRNIDGEYSPLSPNGTAITAVAAPTTAGASVSAEYCLTNYRFLRLVIAYTSGSANVVASIKG